VERGLLHAVLNESNLLIDEEDGERIDFPQMVSTSQQTRNCSPSRCRLRDASASEGVKKIDGELAASGHSAADSFVSKEQQHGWLPLFVSTASLRSRNILYQLACIPIEDDS